ncbi:glycosyltransferase [Vibrio atlanticus]|uniref:Glycosyltransferase n=1 Tax=Vibrio atlanticus TaxID=693153 RepID=A0ABV4KLS9_9VIBR
MSRILIVSDHTFLRKDGKYATSASIPLVDLANTYDLSFYGRLNDNEDKLFSDYNAIDLNKVSICGYENPKKGGVGYILSLPSNIFNLFKEIKRADVIVIKMSYLSSILAFMINKLFFHRPVVSQVIGVAENNLKAKGYKLLSPILRGVTRFVLNNVNDNITVSSALSSHYHLKNSSVICESKLYSSWISEAKLAKNMGMKKIVFVGRLSEEKGLIELYDALKILVDSGEKVSLTLFGDGVLDSTIRMHPLNLLIDICYQGWVQWDKSFVKHLGNYDYLVLPSYTEGLPLVIIEAFSQGVPVIATKVGGIPEIVENQKNGVLVDARSCNDLARGFSELFSLDYSVLSCNCINTAHDYTREKSTEKMLSLIGKYI